MEEVFPENTGIGRVALRVQDVTSVATFYREIIGLDEISRTSDNVTLGSHGEPLLSIESAPTAGRNGSRTGLYHVAFRVPDRPSLGAVLDRVETMGTLDGASNHGFSEALYLRDPDGNGVEIYRDREPTAWPRDTLGELTVVTEPLDLKKLRRIDRANQQSVSPTTIGHVHLAVEDVDRSVSFYCHTLGFDLTMRPNSSIAFLALGSYHHHIGINNWDDPSVPPGNRGLAWFEVHLPNPSDRGRVLDRLSDRELIREDIDGDPAVRDPDGICIRIGRRN